MIYHLRPNIQSWFTDLKKECNIVEVIFFADFSKFREKEKEIKRIRTFTNKIIDTYNPDLHYKKDYTDFIILDNIYQKALSNQDIKMFIIFSGDGHFSSVGAFLRNFCNKEVGIYGVKNCISRNLINSADWVCEVPMAEEMAAPYYNMIFTNLKKCESEDGLKPTFMRTVEVVSANYNVPTAQVRDALSDLIKQGYIIQVQERTKRNEPIRVLHADWQKISADGIWNANAVLI